MGFSTIIDHQVVNDMIIDEPVFVRVTHRQNIASHFEYCDYHRYFEIKS